MSAIYIEDLQKFADEGWRIYFEADLGFGDKIAVLARNKELSEQCSEYGDPECKVDVTEVNPQSGDLSPGYILVNMR